MISSRGRGGLTIAYVTGGVRYEKKQSRIC